MTGSSGRTGSAALTVEPGELGVLEVNRGLLQSEFWALFRIRLGWEARAFRCSCREKRFALLVLIRALGLGQRLAYVPHGPEIEVSPEDRESFLEELAQALRPHLGGCIFIRFDLPWGTEGQGRFPRPLGGALQKAPLDIQPSSTVLLDLQGDEQSLLAAMKSKTRYNIRLSEKKGVEIRDEIADSEAGERALADWYRLYRETARRDKITLHSESYYRGLFAVSGQQGSAAVELHLLSARHEGELLAGIIVALKGKQAWYLYGASSNSKRNLMPAYGLQWQAMRLARERGCRLYDLFGIPPGNDPQHPMHGLYRFKTGFGGIVLNRLGCYDFPYRRALYRGYRGAEELRSLYFGRLRKRLLEVLR